MNEKSTDGKKPADNKLTLSFAMLPCFDSPTKRRKTERPMTERQMTEH
jgi:hypothetical protein